MTDSISKNNVCTDHFPSFKLENYESRGGLQAENDSLKQEVQRLREALRLIYEGSDNITSEGIADIAKQALQQDLTKEDK